MAEVIRKVRPTPTDAYLGNPHKGCCTFQHFNGDVLFPGTSWSEEGPTQFPPPIKPVIDGYLPTTVSYCRWFWRLMEPRKGEYDFSMIDGSLETCRQRGQTLAVRLMAFGSVNQPAAPDWYAQKHPMTTQRRGNGEIRHPVHDAPEYFEHWGGFVREFARRYDGNPLLETIDVTYIGPWGEGDGQCSPEQCRRFAELWKEAFVRTPRMAMVGGDQMVPGVATGAGWRCDCFGDLRNPGSQTVPRDVSWNHMYDAYPMQVFRCGAGEAWRTAPVHFETCWVPMNWHKWGFDLDFILEQGLKYHGTYFMPKYTALPDEWIDKLAAFCRKLGYRYVLRQSICDREVASRGTFRFQCWIENVGVAPIYRRYDFALRLRQGDHEAVIPLSDIDIRTWLPGDVWIDRQIPVPEGFRPGWAELSAGLVDPRTKQVRVRFAVKEQFSDGWACLEGVEVK